MPRIFNLTERVPISDQMKSKDSVKYIYRILTLLGWIPPEHGYKRYLYLIWSFVSFSSTVIFTLGMLLSIILNSNNFLATDYFNAFPVLFSLIGGNIKIFILFISFSCLYKTTTVLDNLDVFLRTVNDRMKINKAVTLSNYLYLLYLRLFIGYGIVNLIGAVIRSEPTWLLYNPFFDWHNGKLQLYGQVAIEFIFGTEFAIATSVIDTFPILFLIAFRAHIDVLKDKIRNLRSDPLKTETDNHEDLVNCIIYHKLILKCCNLMRNLISRVIFIQFIMTGTLLALGLLRMRSSSDLMIIITSIIYIVAALLETFPFSYCCDLLVKDCEDLSNLVAQSQWISAERKYKSTLRIFLHHVQQPITFTAGGLFPISLNTNIQMAKFAFSVMTILQNIDILKEHELD